MNSEETGGFQKEEVLKKQILLISAAIVFSMFIVSGALSQAVDKETLIQQVQTLVDQEKYDEGLVILAGLSEDYPNDAEVMYLAGACQLGKRQFTEAIDTFLKVMQLPGLESNEELMWSTKQDLAVSYYKLDRNTEAMPLFDEILAHKPGDAMALYWVARNNQELRKYGVAFPIYQSALDAATTANDTELIGTCLNRLGECYFQTNMFAEAEPIYQRLIQEYPDRKINWLMMLGRVYMRQGRYDKAISTMEEGIATSEAPNQTYKVRIKLDLAEVYRNLGRPADALAMYQQIESESPNYCADVRLLMTAACYSDQGDYETAEGILTGIFGSKRVGKEAKLQTAEMLLHQGKLNEAMAKLDSLVQQYPDLENEARIRKGEYLISAATQDSSYFSQAVTVLNEADSVNPEVRVKELLFIALTGAGRVEDAENLMNAVIAADTSVDSKCRHMHDLGQFYLNNNRYTDAMQVFTDEKAAAPHKDAEARALCDIGSCFEKMGDDTKAAESYQTVITSYPTTGSVREATDMLAVLQAE